MNKQELSGKDLLLSFLYSPGVCDKNNETIVGRTRLTKMMFLFEKQLYKQFFENSLIIELPDFEAYNYGPFSRKLLEDLSFFESIGMILAEDSGIPLSSADKVEFESIYDENCIDGDDEWNEASFDENEEQEKKYSLSESGKKYVEEQVWDKYSDVQKQKLKKFKAQINKISLDALLRYVYNKYPEEAKKSVIADRYLNQAQ